MRSPDPQLPLVFDLDQAMRLGLSPAQAERRVSTGRWLRLRRGVFCLASNYLDQPPRRRHLIDTMAALRALHHDHWASHLSAASAWGLPSPLGGIPTVTLTTLPGLGSTRRLPGIVVQEATLPAGQRRQHAGIPLTSPARTVVDCLRHLAIPDAVAVADAALHRGLARPEEIAAILSACRTWPLANRASRGLALVDGRRETWLESWSMSTFALAGLPLPVPQVVVLDDRDRFVARVDGAWLDQLTVGEADGLEKYGALDDVDIEESRRRLIREKQREERLVDLGLEMVRWGTRDATNHLADTVARIDRALGRGDRRRFRGRFVVSAPMTIPRAWLAA